LWRARILNLLDVPDRCLQIVNVEAFREVRAREIAASGQPPIARVISSHSIVENPD
jgi:hypothetical protein